MFLCGVETSRGESWKDKKEQDGVVMFGSGVAKAVLRERFENHLADDGESFLENNIRPIW